MLLCLFLFSLPVMLNAAPRANDVTNTSPDLLKPLLLRLLLLILITLKEHW